MNEQKIDELIDKLGRLRWQQDFTNKLNQSNRSRRRVIELSYNEKFEMDAIETLIKKISCQYDKQIQKLSEELYELTHQEK